MERIKQELDLHLLRKSTVKTKFGEGGMVKSRIQAKWEKKGRETELTSSGRDGILVESAKKNYQPDRRKGGVGVDVRYQTIPATKIAKNNG